VRIVGDARGLEQLKQLNGRGAAPFTEPGFEAAAYAREFRPWRVRNSFDSPYTPASSGRAGLRAIAAVRDSPSASSRLNPE
jgi:hypothetical protein